MENQTEDIQKTEIESTVEKVMEAMDNQEKPVAQEEVVAKENQDSTQENNKDISKDKNYVEPDQKENKENEEDSKEDNENKTPETSKVKSQTPQENQEKVDITEDNKETQDMKEKENENEMVPMEKTTKEKDSSDPVKEGSSKKRKSDEFNNEDQESRKTPPKSVSYENEDPKEHTEISSKIKEEASKSAQKSKKRTPLRTRSTANKKSVDMSKSKTKVTPMKAVTEGIENAQAY